jgi:hypothetical protein
MSLIRTQEKTREDFFSFGNALIDSRDLDPVYNLLAWVGHDNPSVDLYWLTFLYMTWYDVESATIAYARHPEPVRQVDPGLQWIRFGTERRGLRTNGVNPMFASAWEHDWEDALDGDWTRWKTSCESIWGWGPWATWKWADLAREVLGWPIRQPDLQLATSTGPRRGLVMLSGLTTLDEQETYASELREASGWSWDVLETVLCKYHAHRLHRYEVGHDVEELRRTIDRMPVGLWASRLHRAHVALFPRSR